MALWLYARLHGITPPTPTPADLTDEQIATAVDAARDEWERLVHPATYRRRKPPVHRPPELVADLLAASGKALGVRCRGDVVSATQRHKLPVAQFPLATPKPPTGGRRPYRRGSDAERSLLSQFWQDGCIAIRSAGSGEPFDLAIILPGGGRLLQVKVCSTPSSEGQIAR